MRIIPFPGRSDASPGETRHVELEAALNGDGAGPAADSWRELREDVRALAPPMTPEFERRLGERIAERQACNRPREVSLSEPLPTSAATTPSPSVSPTDPTRSGVASRRPHHRLRLPHPPGRLGATAAIATTGAVVAAVLIAGPSLRTTPRPAGTIRQTAPLSSGAGTQEAEGHGARGAAAQPTPSTVHGETPTAGGLSATLTSGRVQQLAASIALAPAPNQVQETADRVDRLVVSVGGFVQSSHVQVQQGGPSEAVLELSSRAHLAIVTSPGSTWMAWAAGQLGSLWARAPTIMSEVLNTVTTPSATPPPSGGTPPASMPPEPPHRGWWMAKRFLIAAVSIVVIAGTATYILVLNEVSSVVAALRQNKAVKLTPNVLAPTSGGGPETLLLVGNDQRPPPKNNPNGFVVPHSNEMLLVRIDPSKPTISMMSIPRELQVGIYPPNGPPTVTRINAAYTLGGIQLMTETIKRVVGISVNHVFVITFPKFKRAVDEMGCVYMTVDRRYYHVNEPGGEQYFEINLQPGYQRLCGKRALEFVANRHEDTSLIRDSRDQRFLLEAKAQYGPKLFEDREKFERIFGKAIETDLHGAGQVLDLLRVLAQSQGKPVRQVPFQVNLLPTYDTATPQQIHESVRSFLDGTAPISKRQITHSLRTPRHSHHAAVGLSLVPTPESDLAHARGAAHRLPFALEYPRVRTSYAGAAPDTLRVYHIRDQQGHRHPIYTVVIDRGVLGQFYDVEGTTWSEPPLLSNLSQTIHAGSRTYGLVYEGEHVKTIAWRENGALYWIENTLTYSVSPREMLAMAKHTLPVIKPTSNTPTTTSSASGFKLHPRTDTTSGLIYKLAAILGLASLAVVAFLVLRAFSRQRELKLLREQVAHAMHLEARLRPRLATAGPIPRPDRAQPTIYRTRKGPRQGVLVAGTASIVAALLALGVYFLQSELSSSSSTTSSSHIPVAVFNATGTPNVAHGIAATLKADRIRLGRVGNINASLGHGVFVLYPPGAQTQARAVARLLPRYSPTVVPIQPQVQSAVGQRNEIVVIID